MLTVIDVEPAGVFGPLLSNIAATCPVLLRNVEPAPAVIVDEFEAPVKATVQQLLAIVVSVTVAVEPVVLFDVELSIVVD